MARAALRRLQQTGDDDYDLRATMALALFEVVGAEHTDERIAAFVDALLPIEQLELDPRPYVTG
jgi:hypothetical protein